MIFVVSVIHYHPEYSYMDDTLSTGLNASDCGHTFYECDVMIMGILDIISALIIQVYYVNCVLEACTAASHLDHMRII